MTLTQRQRELRRRHIGASDTPAILGLSPWRTPCDIYWEKTLGADVETNEAMVTGSRLEEAIISYAQDELGIKLRRNQFRVSQGRDNGLLSATFDALAIDRPVAVEAKYVSAHSSSEWGAPGTDEVPAHVLVQCQHQAYVGELDGVWVAAAIADRTLRWCLYWIPRHDDLINMIVERDLAFWNEHILAQKPPSNDPPPIELLKTIERRTEAVTLPEEVMTLVERYRTLKRQHHEIETAYRAAQADLIRALGDAEVGLLPDGTEIRYKPRTRRDIDRDLLKTQHPDIYQSILRETTYRVLTVTGKESSDEREQSAD